MAGEARSVAEILDDIVRWGERGIRLLGGRPRQPFLGEEMVQLAVCKCIEAIGEASGRLLATYPDYTAEHPELELVDAYRTRNRLSHGYASIHWPDVWIVINEDVPRVLAAVRRARESLTDDRP